MGHWIRAMRWSIFVLFSRAWFIEVYSECNKDVEVKMQFFFVGRAVACLCIHKVNVYFFRIVFQFWDIERFKSFVGCFILDKIRILQLFFLIFTIYSKIILMENSCSQKISSVMRLNNCFSLLMLSQKCFSSIWLIFCDF